MQRYYDTKIGQIIDKNFDNRMANMVIAYIVDKGWDNVTKITDEQIAEIQGIMKANFIQALVKTAREICQTCDMWEDFMPYIRCHIGINGYQTEEFRLDREEVANYGFNSVLEALGVDEDVDRIEGFMIVTDEITYEEG